MVRVYFEWMLGRVCSSGHKAKKYTHLFEVLHSRMFKCSIALDENRESDGEDLRYRFGYENDLDQARVAYYLDHGTASVLEVLVAMAMRMDDIMYDESPERWFWDMMESMDLIRWDNRHMDSDIYAEEQINENIDIFLNREFDPVTGEGSPFTVKNNRGQNLREVEFWCLAMWHLTEATEG